MPILSRTNRVLSHPGPWIGVVTNHLDPSYMGSLEVVLLKATTGEFDLQNETVIVKYVSPFYGVTSVNFEGTNSAEFNDVQKSYGMWFVPPDIGTQVMCIFIDGDLNNGYWFGCVADTFQNHMVPGIAASQYSAMTAEQERYYGTRYVPVAEFLKKGRKVDDPRPDTFTKPIHPFAERLLTQGLLTDTIRGVTSSSARREVPSSVFGISTPGPLDPNGKKGYVGYDKKVVTPVSRLGGSTFVMDDGDENGQNELVRIRTRTGHQILLHNSQDLIYIANSKGTAWIEMTSNGKLDIYAQDSVSIHTENDFNFLADRDINIEAKRNINIKSGKNYETHAVGHYYLTIDDKLKMSVRGAYDKTVGDSIKIVSGNNYSLGVSQNFAVVSGAAASIGSEVSLNLGTAGNLNLGANGNLIASGSVIHLNGPAAAAPSAVESPEQPAPMPTFTLPNRRADAGWPEGKFYKAQNISSIMQRVPTHEPWDQHENINPVQFSPTGTDTTRYDRSGSGEPPPSTPPGTQAGAPPQASTPDIVPGTCDAVYAKDINLAKSKQGIEAIKSACKKLGLTSPYAIASLLGIAGGETLWQVVEENFNYRADRLLEVFPSVFKGDRALAKKYEGNPNNSLPEFLYGADTPKGKGLGNKLPGDGGKFIGRGYIGITGRWGYERWSKVLHQKGYLSSPTALVDNPQLLNDPEMAAAVSVVFLLDRCKADPNSPGYFEAASTSVGYNVANIKARKTGYYQCFLAQLASQPPETTPSDGKSVSESTGNPEE